MQEIVLLDGIQSSLPCPIIAHSLQLSFCRIIHFCRYFSNLFTTYMALSINIQQVLEQHNFWFQEKVALCKTTLIKVHIGSIFYKFILVKAKKSCCSRNSHSYKNFFLKIHALCKSLLLKDLLKAAFLENGHDGHKHLNFEIEILLERDYLLK